jgi:cytochrome c553
MKLFVTALFVILVSLNVAAKESDKGDSKDPAQVAAACSGCHNKMINLKGRGVDVIINQTKAIRSSDKSHPAAGIKDLCDEDIAVIAAYLDEL